MLAQKGDRNLKKAKARIQEQNRPVNLKPIELLQFSIKAELKEKPILILSTIFFFTLLVSAFILRATEMPTDEVGGNTTGFKEYANSIWCTFITVMTSKIKQILIYLVGYGDYYPSSILGRCWTVFMMFWGNFIQSLIIVSVASLIEFDKNEAGAYFQITNELALIDSFHSASNLIKSFLRYLIIKRKE